LFASQNLFPRLGELRRDYPLLHIDIETTPHAVARLGEGLDAAIVLARDVDPALYVHPLGTDVIHLIASRELVESGKIKSPQDLEQHTILLHREMETAFDDWKEAVGHASVQPLAIDTYDSGALMLEAAAQGLGIAVLHSSHYTQANDPRLMQLFDYTVESPYRYFFVCRPCALLGRAVKIFHDWLISSGI
jgi:LysR family glycine cleavage system transcriptional activator